MHQHGIIYTWHVLDVSTVVSDSGTSRPFQPSGAGHHSAQLLQYSTFIREFRLARIMRLILGLVGALKFCLGDKV